MIAVLDEKISKSSFSQQQSSKALITYSREGSPEPSNPSQYQSFSAKRRQRSDGTFVSAQGSPFYDRKSESSLCHEYDCVEDETFQVPPVVHIVGEQAMTMMPNSTVAKNYVRTFKIQEFALLRDFCTETGVSGGLAEFYNHVRLKKREEQRKLATRQAFINSNQQKTCWEELLIANNVRNATVIVSKKNHPFHAQATIATHGAYCYLYPAFQQLSPQEQKCRFFEFMQQVKRDDGYKLIVMNDLLKSKESSAEKAMDSFDNFRAFSVRRAQIITVLALKNSQTDISWKEASECFAQTLTSDIPVNYIKELVKHLELEDLKKD